MTYKSVIMMTSEMLYRVTFSNVRVLVKIIKDHQGRGESRAW